VLSARSRPTARHRTPVEIILAESNDFAPVLAPKPPLG
jgi:hypothetical protein